jgi:hypothetical protein
MILAVCVIRDQLNAIINQTKHVRFQVLAAVTMKNAVFWDVSEERSASIIRGS